MSNTSKIAIKGAKIILGIESSTHPFWARFFGFLLKIALSLLAMAFIASRLLENQAHLIDVFSFADNVQLLKFFGVFIIPSMFLASLNWLIEIIKWRLLMNTEMKLSWNTAIKSVFIGTAIGILSPHRSGEFLARVLVLEPKQRIKASILSSINGFSQLLATLSCGGLLIVFVAQDLWSNQFSTIYSILFQVAIILLLIIISIFYYNFYSTIKLFGEMIGFEKYKGYLEVIQNLKFNFMLTMHCLSIVRFFTFVLQYIVVLSFLYESVFWGDIAKGACFTLFSSTLFSFIPVPDLLIRQSVALNLTHVFSMDAISISAGVFLVWIFNLALPATLGTYFMLSHRIINKR